MHPQWQNLMAFYVAGTLPPADAAALERHLTTCRACREALEDWYLIGDSVYAQADDWARGAPPLAPRVRAQLSQHASNGHRRSRAAYDPGATILSYRVQRVERVRRTLAAPNYSLTLAAAMVVIVFLGGLIVMLLARGDTPDSTGSAPSNASATPYQTLGVSSIQTGPSPTPSIASMLPQHDLGILSPEPAPPTATRQPDEGAYIPVPPVASAACTLTNTSGRAQNIYTWPSAAFVAGVLEPDTTATSLVKTADGWYQVVFDSPTGRVNGWVRGKFFRRSNACESLPTPTPTAPTPIGTPQPAPDLTPDITPGISPTACMFFFGPAEGCPNAPQTTTWAAFQAFQGGSMIWREDRDEFYVLYNDRTLAYFTGAQLDPLADNPITETPPTDRYKPVRGFGRIWGHYAEVRDRLGWALAPEAGYTASVQAVNPASAPSLQWYITQPDGRVIALETQRWQFAK